MRVCKKSWQDRRPEWRRRVRWFQGLIGESVTIRLKFTDLDEGRETNRFYTDEDSATSDYEAFISGATVKSLRASQS
jgi:hypothetical protein